MSHFEIYVFVLCFIVFTLLTALCTTMLAYIYRLYKRLIQLGAEDDRITTEYLKDKQSSKALKIVDKIASAALLLIVCAVFIFSLYMNATEYKSPNGIPSLKVVQSASMSYAHDKNTYIQENGLTDQIQTFDIIVTHHIPHEYELELYDIVMYEYEGEFIIHRIVAIEEPNIYHPDCRKFTLQGDAVGYPDTLPVYYSQMRGIYTGQRIPFAGSFVSFMQSPAGYLCILLVLFALVAIPIIEKSLAKEKNIRLIELGIVEPETKLSEESTDTEPSADDISADEEE